MQLFLFLKAGTSFVVTGQLQKEMEETCQMAWGDPAWQDFPVLKSRSPKRTAVIWGAPPCA